MALHTAFGARLADVIAAPSALRSAGIMPLDFDGQPTDQPVVFAWMPAASVFFHDPDGHLLEYIAMLPHEPRALNRASFRGMCGNSRIVPLRRPSFRKRHDEENAQ